MGSEKGFVKFPKEYLTNTQDDDYSIFYIFIDMIRCQEKYG
jgi:hypothetical protein